jgi:hypothetical protein
VGSSAVRQLNMVASCHAYRDMTDPHNIRTSSSVYIHSGPPAGGGLYGRGGAPAGSVHRRGHDDLVQRFRFKERTFQRSKPMTITATSDRRLTSFALWIFVLLNYVYADMVMVIFRPEIYQRAAQGMSEWTALAATVLMEVLIVMPLACIVLKRPASRWTNIAGGVVGTLFVAATLSPRAPLFFWFFGLLEIACTLFIIWYAWTWRDDSAPLPAQPRL